MYILTKHTLIIVIIMCIYHALMRAHMIHINLNTIFYTHVEHSPTKTIYIKYYLKKLTFSLLTEEYSIMYTVSSCMIFLSRLFVGRRKTSRLTIVKFGHILTPYKVPQGNILVCSAFSGEKSREETASVIQFVGSERANSQPCDGDVVDFVVIYQSQDFATKQRNKVLCTQYLLV